MEFWGVEVKSGQHLVVEPGVKELVHVSQACLEDVKKDKRSDCVPLYVKVGDQKLGIGMLSHEKFPQLSFDLVFEKKFELSHDWKNGSVHISGYKAMLPLESDDSDADSEEEEVLPIGPAKNEAKPAAGKANDAKPDATPNDAKPGSSSAKPKVNFLEPIKDDESETGESSSSSDESEEDQVMANGEDDSSDEDDSSEEDEQPIKAEISVKRKVDSGTKTHVPDKKAKLVTPQKTDGKQNVHTATPFPSKKTGKQPALDVQAKKQTTPSSSGSHACKSCNRVFKDDRALQSHTKAKHGAAA